MNGNKQVLHILPLLFFFFIFFLIKHSVDEWDHVYFLCLVNVYVVRMKRKYEESQEEEKVSLTGGPVEKLVSNAGL